MECPLPELITVGESEHLGFAIAELFCFSSLQFLDFSPHVKDPGGPVHSQRPSGFVQRMQFPLESPSRAREAAFCSTAYHLLWVELRPPRCQRYVKGQTSGTCECDLCRCD